MIDGLKLTMSGKKLRAILRERIEAHTRSAEWWRQQQRTEEQTDEEPLLPDEMCNNESERRAWRAKVLSFIRDHIDANQTYRLGSADVEFGDLLPAKPGWVEQEEYEERTSVGFHLERLTKAFERLPSSLELAARMMTEPQGRSAGRPKPRGRVNGRARPGA